MKRYVDPVKAARVVADAPPGEAAAKLRRWMERQPSAPTLVSRKVAAEILNVHSPYIARLQEQGRMPEPIPVAGSAPVWEREEVEALADEIKRERERRERRRKESR